MTTTKCYFDIAMPDGGQTFASLQDKNLKIAVPGAWAGVCDVHALYIEVEYTPVHRRTSEDVRAQWIFGVEDSGVGTGDLIWNPALVIQNILEDFLGFTGAEINEASFTAAAAELGDATFSFCLQDQMDSWRLISELALQGRCHIYAEVGEYVIKFRPFMLPAPDRTIINTGVTGFIAGTTRLVPLGLESVFNKITVKYSENYTRDSEPFALIATAEDSASQDAYGLREQIINAWAIRTTTQADLLASLMLAKQKDIRYLYKFQSYLSGNLDLERGDVLNITDATFGLAAAVGEIVSIRYIPGGISGSPGRESMSPFLAEFTVLLETYRWGDPTPVIPDPPGDPTDPPWTPPGDWYIAPVDGGPSAPGAGEPTPPGFGVIYLNTAAAEDPVTLEPIMRWETLPWETLPGGERAGRVKITGRVVERQVLAATTENPVQWDATTRRLKFSLTDNTTCMELGADGNLYLPERDVNRQDLTYAGDMTSINSNATILWFNAGGIRVLESDSEWLKVAGVIVENVNTNDLI